MPRHGGDKGIGYNEGGGGEVCGVGGVCVKEMQLTTQETKRQPKYGRQTIAREIG